MAQKEGQMYQRPASSASTRSKQVNEQIGNNRDPSFLNKTTRSPMVNPEGVQILQNEQNAIAAQQHSADVASGANLTPEEIAALIAGAQPVGEAPSYLGLSPQMNSIQKRTAIATGGLSGNDPRFRDEETFNYYKNLVLNSVGKENSDPTAIETQFLSEVFSRLGKPGDTSREGFLSSLSRAKGSR